MPRATQTILMLLGVLALFGFAGHSDYTDQLETERDDLQRQVMLLSNQLALTRARCGAACDVNAIRGGV